MAEFQTLAEANKNPELDNAKPLKEFLKEVLIVESFDLIEVGENQCAVIKTDRGLVSSFSKVIIDQLGKLNTGFEAGKKAKLRPVQEKNYHKFEDVE
jgi:hypothetical protein